MDVSELDQELLDAVAERLGAGETALVHPSVLFRVVSRIRSGDVPVGWLAEHARYERFDTPPTPPDPTQEPYVAVRLRFANCFQESRLHRQVMDDILGEVSRRVRVVVFNPDNTPGLSDSIGANDRIRAVATGKTEHALRDQAAVITGARAFVGTFGGISLMAPFYDIPTALVFGEEIEPFPLQAAVARDIAATRPDRPFELMRTTDFDPARLGAWVDRVLQ